MNDYDSNSFLIFKKILKKEWNEIHRRNQIILISSNFNLQDDKKEQQNKSNYEKIHKKKKKNFIIF